MSENELSMDGWEPTTRQDSSGKTAPLYPLAGPCQEQGGTLPLFKGSKLLILRKAGYTSVTVQYPDSMALDILQGAGLHEATKPRKRTVGSKNVPIIEFLVSLEKVTKRGVAVVKEAVKWPSGW